MEIFNKFSNHLGFLYSYLFKENVNFRANISNETKKIKNRQVLSKLASRTIRTNHLPPIHTIYTGSDIYLFFKLGFKYD